MTSPELPRIDNPAPISPPPSLHDIDRLLDRLGTDEAFRRDFMRAPHDALAGAGLDPAALARLPPGGRCTALAGKDAFAAARDALRAQRMSCADLTKPPTVADGIRRRLR